MEIIVDTGIFVAVRNRKDRNHEYAKELMKRALKAEFEIIPTANHCG